MRYLSFLIAFTSVSPTLFAQEPPKPPATAPVPQSAAVNEVKVEAPKSIDQGPWSSVLANLTPRSIGPTSMGGRVSDLAVFEKEPRIFYVATASGGLWKTTNAGLTFAPVFDREATISMGAVAVSQKNPDIVWLGTGEASSRNSVAWGDGVYRSEDGGKTWKKLGLGATHHISKIILHPRDEKVAYVAAVGRLWGTSEERGLYKTVDTGKTWTKVLSIDERTGIGDLVMHPRDPDTLIAAAWERLRLPYDFLNGGKGSGLFKSTNGGKSWKKITKGLPPGPFGRFGLSYHLANPRLLVATVEYKAPGEPVRRQEEADETDEEREFGFDGQEPAPAPTPPATPGQAPVPQPGAKQEPAKQPEPAKTPETKAEPAKPAPKDEGPKGGTYISTDGGESWKFRSTTNPRPFYFSMPRFDPVDPNLIYVPAVNIHVSKDQGKTFTTLRMTTHVDHHAMWINPADTNHILIGQDGGVAVSRDKGASWQMLNGLPIGQFYAIGFDMRRPYWVYGGLQDNGTWASPTQTRRVGPAHHHAFMINGGDGFYVQVDPTDWRTVYSESQGGAAVRTDQVTGQQKFIRPRPPQGERYRFNWSTPIHLSPHNPRILFIGGNKLFRSVSRGDSWDVISPDLTTNDPEKQRPGKSSPTPDIDSGAERHCTIVTISESPMKAGLIWVGTDDGLVQVTRDGGQTWTNVTANIAEVPKNLWCSRVIASKHVEGRAYVTFDGHRSNEFRPFVFVTEDFGKTWKSLSNGLPDNDPLYVVREGERNPDLLFLGSEMSLNVSLDRGATWGRFRSGGFPTVAVHDLAIHPVELDLVIGTHGRSIWTLNVSALEALSPAAMKSEVVAIRPQDVLLLGRVDTPSFAGDGEWVAKNTQPGTQICYWLKDSAKEDVKVIVSDVAGTAIQELKGAKTAGLNVVQWNGRIKNRMVEAGDYRIAVQVDGKEYLTFVRVVDVSAGF